MTGVQPPRPAAVELAGPDGTVRGITWAWPAADIALLFLHDLGADLDSVRWLAEPVAAAGITVLCIDLPGHGLSDGRRGSAVAAITAGYHALSQAVPGVTGVIADGRAASLLLATELDPVPVAAGLLGPERAPRSPAKIAPNWRLVPKLVVTNADRDGGDRYARSILDATNAWCLRADLARPGDGGEGDEVFAQQVTSLMVKFMLEQAAFELSGRQMAAANAAQPVQGEETGWSS